eukprot:jgi/Ulvmu1/10/UM001_0010.1
MDMKGPREHKRVKHANENMVTTQNFAAEDDERRHLPLFCEQIDALMGKAVVTNNDAAARQSRKSSPCSRRHMWKEEHPSLEAQTTPANAVTRMESDNCNIQASASHRHHSTPTTRLANEGAPNTQQIVADPPPSMGVWRREGSDMIRKTLSIDIAKQNKRDRRADSTVLRKEYKANAAKRTDSKPPKKAKLSQVQGKPVKANKRVPRNGNHATRRMAQVSDDEEEEIDNCDENYQVRVTHGDPTNSSRPRPTAKVPQRLHDE